MDQRLAAKAEEITTAFTDADLSLSQRSTRLEASSVPSALNANASFDQYTSPSSWPDGWAVSSYLTGASFVQRVVSARGDYAMRLFGAGGGHAIAGALIPNGLNDDAYYVIEARWTLNSGSLRGSGILFRQNMQDGSGDMIFGFEGLIGVGQPGVSYSLSRLVRTAVMGNGRNGAVIALSHFPIGDINFSEADITWDQLQARPATPAEIRDQTVLEPLRAKVETIEVATTDGRFATAQRAGIIEATVDNAVGRISTVETATTDGRFAAAQAVTTLRSEYDGTVATVSQQAGTLVDLQSKAAAYVRLTADAGNGYAQLSLWSDQYGGAWELVGNGRVRGNLVVDGTISSRSFDAATMAQEAIGSWGGVVEGVPGGANVPFALAMNTLQPRGRFLIEKYIVVVTNAGQQVIQNNYNGTGRNLYTNYIADGGGLILQAMDAQGNVYRIDPSGVFESMPVRATTPFAPTFRATVFRGSQDTGVVNQGDYYERNVSANYAVTSISLKVTWLAI